MRNVYTFIVYIITYVKYIPYIQAGFRKGKRIPETNIYFCFTDYTKAFDCVHHNKLWKIIKEMGILDHLTCLLRNLCADQEAKNSDG